MNKFDKDLIKKYLPKEKWEDSFKKLESGYPVQYIIGNVDFCDSIINVNENVLIPRFETEFLVDYLIKMIKKYNYNCPYILDIGTGSGCISIALKQKLDCSIKAIDINGKAIDVAKDNAKLNNVLIDFENISIEKYNSNETFDIIVSNPPYVDFNEIVDEKIKYEPQNAIFAKDNGLYFYKVILNKSKELLKKKNIIAFEIGATQANEITNITKSIYPNSQIIVKKDLNNFDRYIFIINE